MKNDDIRYLVESRNRELSSDEILQIIDTERNPQIDHMVFENNIWKVWDNNGNYYEFTKRS